MKKIFSILLILVCCIGLGSCNKKEMALSNLEAFTDDISENANEYTAEQWDEAEAEYDDILQELDQYEYTPAEQRKIGRLKARCAKAMARKSIRNIQYGIENIINQVTGAIDEFTGNSDNEDEDY